MALSDEHKVWIGGTESADGVDAVAAKLAANDNILFQLFGADSDMTPAITVGNVEAARPSQDGMLSYTKYEHTDIALRTWPRPGIGANHEPEDAFLWRTMFDLVSAAGVTTATLRTSVDDSASIWELTRKYKADLWRLRKALGARFSLSITDEANGDPATISWVGQSKNCVAYSDALAYFDADDQPQLDEAGDPITYTGAATMASEDILRCSTSTLSWNSINLDTDRFSLDVAYQIAKVAKPGCTGAYRITQARGGNAATGSVGIVCTEDDEAGIEAIRTAIASRTPSAMVKRFENATKYFQMAMYMQFEGRDVERRENGVIHFDVPFRLVANRTLAPFGDNSLVCQWGAIT